MIKKLEINGVHADVTDDLRKYVFKKIGRLDTYLPRHARESVHAEVKLKEGKVKTRQTRTCEVIMHLPQEVLTVTETTINMHAAVDIVEEKLKHQLRKYKELHAGPRIHRRMFARFTRRHSDVAGDLGVQ